MNNKTLSRTLISLVPIVVLVTLLIFSINIYGSDSLSGASQVALLLACMVCVALSVIFFKTPWQAFEDAIKENVADVSTAIIILFLIGAISGTWTASGIIPTFIYYGVKIISPKFFLLTACIICSIVSVMTGSSWTTIATIGVALLGIGKAEGFSDAITAGAIISGAYFGDKFSPLSDCTVLASSMNRVPLFEHIRYTIITTVPSMAITLILFTVLGFSHGGGDTSQVGTFTELLGNKYNISLWLLLVPAATGLMIARRMPALVVLSLSALLAAIVSVIAQPQIINEIGSKVLDAPHWKVQLAGMASSAFDSVSVETGNADVNSLVASKGMVGMFNTVFLIIAGMCFGGAMKASGMINNLAVLIQPFARKRGSLVGATVVSGTVLNCLASDQYLSIILTSDLFRGIYEREGYEAKLLSRSVGDSSTVTSPLIPWSSCGMAQSTILSVPTLTYLPYCFFNIISPVVSVAVAVIGYKIFKKE